MTPIRLLLVDDHNLFRRSLADVLAAQDGYQVVGEARDGLEAIEKARALQPDLILMDLSMPRCDGLEATRQISRELPTVVILILTAWPRDVRVAQALAGGARGYLEKDADVSRMLEALHRLVTTDPGRGNEEQGSSPPERHDRDATDAQAVSFLPSLRLLWGKGDARRRQRR